MPWGRSWRSVEAPGSPWSRDELCCDASVKLPGVGGNKLMRGRIIRMHARVSRGGCPREDWGLNGYVMTVSEMKRRCVVGLQMFMW